MPFHFSLNKKNVFFCYDVVIKYFIKFMLEVATVRNYHELIKQGYGKEANQLLEGKKYFLYNLISLYYIRV